MNIQDIFARLSFDAATRSRTWNKLATQAHYGLPLKDSLPLLRNQVQRRNPALASVFDRVLERMGSGHQLGTAFTGYASPEEIMLITSGQKAGRLSEGLKLASELIDSRKKISTAVVGALAYPLFLLLLAVAMLTTVSFYVMPELVHLSDPRQWTGFARGLYLISSFLGSWAGVVFFILSAGACLGVIITLPIWTGRTRRIADRFAPWSMYRLMVGSVWLFTLATLMRSGKQISEILKTMLASEAISPYLSERVKAINDYVIRGENLGKSMYLSGMDFPDRSLIDDFRTYATLPHFKEQLHNLSRDWLQEGIAAIQRKARILNIAFLLFIIGQMLLIALSVMDLQAQLSAQTMGGIR